MIKQLIILKNTKKIRVEKLGNFLKITGPLGCLIYKFSHLNFHIFENSFFMAKKIIYFFKNKIKITFNSVVRGWFFELQFKGLGYKSFRLRNGFLAFDLGYTNLVTLRIRDDLIKIKNFKNKIVLFSIDNEYLSNLAFFLKNFSTLDPYKGKGIFFSNEIINLKKKREIK